MAYVVIPTRIASVDPAAAADVNQLMDNIEHIGTADKMGTDVIVQHKIFTGTTGAGGTTTIAHSVSNVFGIILGVDPSSGYVLCPYTSGSYYVNASFDATNVVINTDTIAYNGMPYILTVLYHD
jgi:hypothetical protein